jgi:catalase
MPLPVTFGDSVKITIEQAPRLLLVGAILAAAAAALAFAGGAWGRPLTSSDLVTALERRDGRYPALRRAHAKGACFTGHFDGNGRASGHTRARSLAAGERSRVVGRFSTGGGKPRAPDGRLVFRGMALQLTASNGEEWRTAMDHTPTFMVKTAEDFFAFQVAHEPRADGKPDPALVSAFLDAHPETRAFQAYLKQAPIPSSFANGTYYGINAFYFVNATGERQGIRWSFEPEAPFERIEPGRLAEQPPDFLFEDVKARVAAAPLRWALRVTLAQPGDPLSDATQRWPESRPSIMAGQLVIDQVTPEGSATCRDLNYDPLVLPAGIEPSADPLLAARSAAYAVSFRRRAEGAREARP